MAATKTARVACALLLALLACQAYAAVVIRAGVAPYSKETTIVCHKNEPHVVIAGKYTPVAYWNGGWYPTSAVVAFNLLDRDARSCSKITTYKGPNGGHVTTVNKVGH